MGSLWINKQHNIATSEMFDKSHSREAGQRILEEIKKNWNKKKKGYRKGVFLVPINSELFKSNIVKLSEGDYLLGKFEKRVKNEIPRKKFSALAKPSKLMPLKGVDVVVYSSAVLEENGDYQSISDFEALIVLKKVVKGNQPMPPETMMYNFYKGNGGTDMKCSDSEFVSQLKESFVFWKDKAIIN
jgi:hypothetical protein